MAKENEGDDWSIIANDMEVICDFTERCPGGLYGQSRWERRMLKGTGSWREG